ncbi:MAG: TolC family protein [Planctomycetota bacterium]
MAGAAGLDPSIAAATEELLGSPLTEDAAVRIALLENRDVRAGLARFGIARADLVQAGLLRNPVFDGNAKFFIDGGTEVELGLAQPFLDLFWRPLRQRIAEAEFHATRSMLTHELVDLAFAVRRGFVRLRAAQQLVGLQQRAVDTAVAAHALMQQLHAAGNVTDVALAAERVTESRARLDLHAAERAAREAREPLQELLGLWGKHTQWTVTQQLDLEPLAGWDPTNLETRCVAASLDLQEQRAYVDALAQRAGLESWRGWLPEANVGVAAKRDTADGWGLGPAVAFELPLFDRGAARQDRAAAALREGLQHHVQLAVQVRSAARLLRDRATTLGDRLRFLRDTHLPLREDFVRKTLQHYNAMQIGAFDVLRARQQQLADEREELYTLRDAHLVRLDLQELLAGGMPRHSLEPTWPEFGSSDARATTGGH